MTIVLNDKPTKILWDGYQGSTPGLVVHREIMRQYGNSEDYTNGSTWGITHLESGRKVDFAKGFMRRKDAESMAKYLAPFCDWTMTEREILEAKPFKGVARDVAAKAKEIAAG